jgi:flotillin
MDYSTPIGAGAIILIVILLVWFLVSRYKTPTINEAYVISGSNGKDDNGNRAVRVLQNRGGFVWPFINRVVSISLKSHQISTECDAISKEKIKIHLKVVTTFKVNNTDEDIRLAAQRFSRQEQIMEPYVKEIIEGSMRSIVGGMTVESLLSDRLEFTKAVRDEVADSITIQGLSLDTLQIQEINDQTGYIDALGAPQEASVKKAATIAEANAKQEAQQAQIAADREIALSQKDLALQQASIKADIGKADVNAEAVKSLEQQAQNKKIAEAEALAEAENVKLQRVRLESDVNTKADAEKYKRKTDAEAQAEVTRQNADAEAAATKARAVAEAEAIRAQGEAKADAVRAQGLAEAEAMNKKAEAYRKYGQAALQSLIIEKLPELAASLSKPLEGATITSVGTDAQDRTSSLVTDLAAKLPTLVNTLTGVDLAKSLRELAHQNPDPDGAATADTPAGTTATEKETASDTGE